MNTIQNRKEKRSVQRSSGVLDLKTLKTSIDGKANLSHTHNYAGSSSAGGAATSALACTGNSATATKATQDSAGQQINKTYIKGLSVSGKTITYTKGDGTTGTITTQDTNTTYSTGTATSSGLTKLYTGTGTATDGTMTQAAINTALSGKAAASHGNHVPSTQTANARVFLRNDNTWQTLPSASTSATGIVQLNDAINSTSTTQAATANAVKKAYDRANEAFQSASDGKTKIATAITGKGVAASSSDTFDSLATKISSISTGIEFVPATEDTGALSPGGGTPKPKPIIENPLGENNLFYKKVTGIISGSNLRSLTGCTSGTLAHSGDITWLKFKVDGKTLFVADRNIVTGISWDDIDIAGCVRGKIITINGKKYLCRLLTGGNSTSASRAGGEWNNTIVKYTPNNSDSNWSNVYSWCQEVSSSSTSTRVERGGSSVSYFARTTSSYTTSAYGWRPILEVL